MINAVQNIQDKCPGFARQIWSQLELQLPQNYFELLLWLFQLFSQFKPLRNLNCPPKYPQINILNSFYFQTTEFSDWILHGPNCKFVLNAMVSLFYFSFAVLALKKKSKLTVGGLNQRGIKSRPNWSLAICLRNFFFKLLSRQVTKIIL